MGVLSGFAPVDGTSLYYEISGSGPAVVLMHAFSFDRRMWDQQAELLESRYTLLRYDLRGFGRSAPANVGYTHAGDLSALLDHLGFDEVALVGLSLGGGAAINFSILCPDLVWGLVVADPSLGGFRWPESSMAEYVALRETARTKGIAAARAEWVASSMFATARASTRLEARLAGLVGEYSGWHWLNDDPGRPLSPPAIERLNEITAPTLVIVGERDAEEFRTIAATIVRGVPNAREAVIGGAGHMVNLEKPDAFNAVVLEFLESVGRM